MNSIYIYGRHNITSTQTLRKQKRSKGRAKEKHVGINLMKYAQDLYTETAKYCQGRFTEDLNEYRDTPCSYIEKLSIVKMSALQIHLMRPA